MSTWNEHRDSLINRLPQLGPGPDVLISNNSGSVVVSRSRFDAFKGRGEALPYAVLGLCLGGGGRTYKESHFGYLDDIWRPGRVGLALPGPAAEGITPAMDMLGIAFDINDIPACHGRKLNSDDLSLAANQLFDDDLVSTILMALLRDAEAHGASSVFFDHGISLALHRLLTRASGQHSHEIQTVKPSPLDSARDMIEANLGKDLRIKDLAKISGIDARTFTRKFKRETGYTPYQYLTSQRMEHAKDLLRSDHSVTDVALAVGYANPAKFASAFRRWVGTAPSHWKKDIRH